MEFHLSEARLHALDYLQIIRNRFSIILLTFCLIFITAVAITHIMPEEYLGKATVEIVQNDDDLRLFGAGVGADYAGLQFIQTQFEIISSQQTLYRVVDELDLVNRWNLGTRQAAVSLLANKLETSARRNTSLIDVEVFADDPEEAAELANAVSESYAERRRLEDQQRIDKALGALNDELDKQRERVANHRNQMLKLMRDHNIVDLARTGPAGLGANGEPMTTTPGVLMTGEQRVYTLKSEIEQLRTQMEKLKELSGDDLIKMAISLQVADASVTQVYPQYLDQSIQLERLRNLGLGAKHPKITALEREIEKMRSFLESGVETIRDTLDTQLRIATESLARIEKLQDDKQDESMAEREDYVAYAEAKNEYNRQNGLLQAMEENYHEVAIEKNMTTTPIRIHERAEPRHKPAKPNVVLNLILGGVIGLGMGLALAFFVEYLDTSVKSLDEVEELMGVPVLAVIPKDIGLIIQQGGASPDAEAYRILRTNIEFNRDSPSSNVIAVVSGSAGEGKSTTLANLACVSAQGGRQHPDHRWRHEAPPASPVLRRIQRTGTQQLPDRPAQARRGGSSDPGEEPLVPPQRDLAARSGRFAEFETDDRIRRGNEIPLRHRPDRLPADPRCQRFLRAGPRSRPHHGRCSAPETSAENALTGQAGDRKYRRDDCRSRSQQRRHPQRQPIPVLHQLLHLLLDPGAFGG